MDNQSILNVDDYAPTRYCRSTTLRQGGFTVHEAATGGEALEKLSLRPALVLLDVNLPDINGFEVCRRIRADPQASGTIVIHMSASSLGPRDQVRGLENGADLFLTEPTDGEVLVATVKAQLRARVAEAAVRRANESLESLTDMLSHELRQSLRSVLLPAELLDRRLRGQVGPEEAELLEQTVSNGRRMNELIEGVLSFSRAEREQCELSDIRAADALRASVDELHLALAESGAKLEFADLPEVRGNEVSLARVFCNLIVNAIKYRGPHPPHIRIDAEIQGNRYYRFAVRDNGIGIAPEYQSQIFQPFKRLHGSGHDGVGIGLSLCKRLIQNMGGEIWVESEAGRGATLYFTLPRAHSASCRAVIQ